MLDFFFSLGGTFPYLGIVLFLILTGCGLPIPEEVTVVAAGVLSEHGTLIPPYAYLSCVVGALLGDILVYSIGRYPGHNFLRRHPWFARLLHEEREKQMEELIKKHGFKVFFVARFMVGVRVPLYLAAGVVRMSWWRFLLINSVCATTVVSVAFWLGYCYGGPVSKFIRESQYGLTLVVIVAVIAGLVYYVVQKKRKRSVAKKDAEGEPQAAAAQKVSDTDRIVA
jgi:membrane protein DedA with SNARE-associated domain